MEMFTQLTSNDITKVKGGYGSWNCRCYCVAPDYLGGYVYYLSWAGGRVDCDNKCYRNARSDFWSCDYPY